MAVQVKGAAAAEVQRREGMQVMVVAATDNGATAFLRHDEGQRGFAHLAVMHGDPVRRRHVDEHAAEPVVGARREQIRRDAELRAAERGRDCIAPERDRVVAGDGLLVSGRQRVGQESDVDIALSDEQRFHDRSNPFVVVTL
jgi:hypothetical protein